MAEDLAETVRNRAYLLWERAGRPCGREHEFWAQASLEIEGDRKEEEERLRRERIVAR